MSIPEVHNFTDSDTLHGSNYWVRIRCNLQNYVILKYFKNTLKHFEILLLNLEI
jgi:hypothetical protein